MHLYTKVSTPDGEMNFEAVLHPVSSENSTKIPREFYEKYTTGGFKLPHCEIEIVLYPDTDKPLHVVDGADGGEYVCYPPQIATTEDAIEVWRAWCVGSACTITGGKDLNTLCAEAGGIAQCQEYVAREAGITVISSTAE